MKKAFMVIVAVLLIAVGVVTPAVAQEASYPPPEGGYTCFPTCADGMTDYDGDGEVEPQDGRFISMPSEDMDSFGGAKTVLWISVPGDYEGFEIGIFDGDSGKDAGGNIDVYGGHWDETTTESTYTLFADPLKDGSGDTEIEQWLGNQDPMPNNDWYDITVNNVPEAQGPSGHYFYRLEITRPTEGAGINAFKLRSDGYISTGQANLVDANFAIVGMMSNANDRGIIYPQYGGYNNPGPSTYDGAWTFSFYVADDKGTIEFWDGDFDRGTSAIENGDTDDPNTEGTPPWADDNAVIEGEQGMGSPADDYGNLVYRREPPVWYELIHPDGSAIYVNDNPSGTEEWEWFSVSTDPNVDADVYTEYLGPGYYTWNIIGLDLHNTVWIRVNYEIVDQPTPPVWPEPECPTPRTIGYWKNNVEKVLIKGWTMGVQETPESLAWALRNVALASPLFRSGIDVNNPTPIDGSTPLTPEEANMILQRDKRSYPGGRDAANSMLARALQQNLAAWLNLGSGKIHSLTPITLEAYGGTFEGTAWEALQEAQSIILSSGDLERAKDLADQFNNLDFDCDDALCDKCDPCEKWPCGGGCDKCDPCKKPSYPGGCGTCNPWKKPSQGGCGRK